MRLSIIIVLVCFSLGYSAQEAVGSDSAISDMETTMAIGKQEAHVQGSETYGNGGRGLRLLQATTSAPTPAPTSGSTPPPAFNPTIGFLIIVFGWFGLLGGGVCIWRKYCKRGNGAVSPH